MSSLPTSDGFNHPAHSLGQSPEIDSPPSLAHSVSASVCPMKPSEPDSIEPAAMKASAEFLMNSRERGPLSPQDLPDLTPSADQTPVMPLHNSSEEAVITDCLQKSDKSTQGLEFSLHTRQEASLSVTATTVHEPLTFVDEKNWHPESQNPSQVNSLQQQHQPGSEQHEVAQQRAPWHGGHLCDTGDVELCEESPDQPKLADVEAAMKDAGHQENVLPAAGCSSCSDADTVMEVDIVEQSLVTTLDSAGYVSTGIKNTGVLYHASDSLSMEVEPSKQDPSSESLSNSVSTQDLQSPGSNVDISGTNKEHGNYSPSSSCQPSIESEESCSSVTAALKELHELLVISSKPAPENASEEINCQSETIDERQIGIEDLSGKWTHCEHLTHREQCPQVSCHQASSVSVKIGNADLELEDGENACFRGPGGDQSADKEGVPRSRGSVSERSSDTVTSAKSSSQLHCTLGVVPGERGEGGALSQTSEQMKSLQSGFLLVQDLGQGRHNPATARPGTGENVCPEATRSFLELEPPASQPSSSPSTLPPFIFPAADIDRILRAGFTLQEALGALHRVGGDADLALLVLLAKNIVVPT